MPARIDRPIRRSPKSDPQQYRLYRMESEAIGGRQYLTLSKAKIRSLLRTLCKQYHVRPVQVVFENSKRCSAEWQAPGIITICRKATSQDLLTVVHEFAHHLHFIVDPSNKQQAHGPEFLCCYMAALDGIRLIPIAAMAAICDEYKIKYIVPSELDGVDQLRRKICGRSRPAN